MYFGGVTPLYAHRESIPKDFLSATNTQAMGQDHVFNEISTNIFDSNTTTILITEGFSLSFPQA